MINIYIIYGITSMIVFLLIMLILRYFSRLRAVEAYARVNNSENSFPVTANITKLGLREIFKYHLKKFNYPHCLVRVKGQCLSKVEVFDKNLLVVKITQDTNESWHISNEKLFFGQHSIDSSTFLILNFLQLDKENAKTNYKVRNFSNYSIDASTGNISVSSVKYDESGIEQEATHESSQVLGIVVENLSSIHHFRS